MTIYVISNFEVNHNPKSSQPHRRLPVDPRLLDRAHPYTFYLTDERSYPIPSLPSAIWEADLDPLLHEAGKTHLAEWSFLLAEEKHAFCSYPFFMISSRFYMKNSWLRTDLNEQWAQLFSYFETYSHGFLPSYCRPMRWVKFSSLIQNPRVFFPFTEKFFTLVQDLYQIQIPRNYSVFPDLGCHYLGFKNRQALLEYTSFYKPIFDYFFTEEFKPTRNILDYVKKSGHYPNEKPLTFLFETLSHLFFFKEKRKFFALHYDGYYELDLSKKKFRRIKPISLPFFIQIKRKLQWRKWWFLTEGPYRYVYKSMLLAWRFCKKYALRMQLDKKNV